MSPWTLGTQDGVRIRAGQAPLLLMAPHGGRREPERRPWTDGSLRVNDLHTADLTTCLADRLDAHAIVNEAIDRNDVDLNRIAQARRHAPRFLEAIASRLRAILDAHGEATVLLIHGWNISAPACDLGTGTDLVDGNASRLEQAPVSISRDFLGGPLKRFVEGCRRRDIRTGLGWRYPAKNRHNLIQLFTGRYLGDSDPLLHALATLGEAANAVQLELSIPLRWPGPRRRELEAAIQEAFAPTSAAPPDRPLAPRARRRQVSPRRIALQAHDRATGLGLVAAWDLAVAGMGARFLILPPAGGLYLFTGETPDGPAPAALQVGPLALALSGHDTERFLLRHRGPFLFFPDTAPFLDLESGLSRAVLCEAEVEISFAGSSPEESLFSMRDGSAPFRRHLPNVRGKVEIAPVDGGGPLKLGISGHGLLEQAGFARDANRFSVYLPPGPLGAFRIVTPWGGPASIDSLEQSADEKFTVDGIAVNPEEPAGHRPLLSFHIRRNDGAGLEVAAHERARVPIVRQASRGRVSRHLLALCDITMDGKRCGRGWAEVSLNPPTPETR